MIENFRRINLYFSEDMIGYETYFLKKGEA